MEIRTLCDVFYHSVDGYRKAAHLRFKRDGAWRDVGSAEFRTIVEELSAGLRALGIERGDRVAILSENRPEWAYADLATLTAGAVDAPIYATLTPPQVLYILNDSASKAIFVSGEAQARKVAEVRPKAASLQHVIVMDETPLEGTLSLAAVRARGRDALAGDPGAVRRRAAEDFAVYGTLPSYRAMLDREGAAGPADVALVGDESTIGKSIQRLSDRKLARVDTGVTRDAIIKDMVRCNYVKSADLADRYGDPSALNPELDPDIVGPAGIFSQAEFNGDGEFRKTAAVMKLVINGYAGAGTITMGGYDYHGQGRATGEIRDLRAGRCMGACLEYAARRGVPLMLYVFSDGSLSADGVVDNTVDGRGKFMWTSDNQQTAASFFLVYNPGGRAQLYTGDNRPVCICASSTIRRFYCYYARFFISVADADHAGDVSDSCDHVRQTCTPGRARSSCGVR